MIKIGQLGIGHNHGDGHMIGIRNYPEGFELIGYAEPDEEWVKKRGNLECYQGVPRLDVEMYYSHVDFADNAYKNIKERIEVPDVASRDRYNDMMKEFHDLITGEIVDPHIYTHDLAVQRTLIKAIGGKL